MARAAAGPEFPLERLEPSAVAIKALALQVGCEGADQKVVVGEGVGQGVQDQALPLRHAAAVQVLGAGEVGVDLVAVVGDQRLQFRRHAVADRARGGCHGAGCGCGRPSVTDLLQACGLLRAVGCFAAPLGTLARVG
jgi:hypothetical protein